MRTRNFRAKAKHLQPVFKKQVGWFLFLIEERDKPVKGGKPQPPTLMVASEVLCPKQMPQISCGGEATSFQAGQAGQGHAEPLRSACCARWDFHCCSCLSLVLPMGCNTARFSSDVVFGAADASQYMHIATSCCAGLEVSHPPATHLAPVTTEVTPCRQVST